jgi:hypothetical protein
LGQQKTPTGLKLRRCILRQFKLVDVISSGSQGRIQLPLWMWVDTACISANAAYHDRMHYLLLNRLV